MGYRVKGTLKLPDGTPGTNCEIEFTSRKNFTPVLTGMGVSVRTDSAGAYDVTLEYGAYAVILRTGNTYPTAIGQIIVASDTVVGQDLPTLLEQSGWQPATPEYIAQINAWLARAETAATSSEAAKVSAKESEVLAKASEGAALASKNSAELSADTATQKALAAAESKASAFSSATMAELSATSAANSAASASAAVLDAERRSLERATGGKQTIIYDAAGNANAMFVLPRFTYADLGMTADMGTGDVTAFDFGSGSIKSEIFIGAYLASGSGAVSAPRQDPRASLDHTAARAACAAKGAGWHLMTVHEWAAIALWCVANGYEPLGNTNWGRSHAKTWLAGGRADGRAPGDAAGIGRTKTGSMGAEATHDRTLGGIADLVGNTWEWQDGLLLQGGQIKASTHNTQPEADWALQAAFFDAPSSAPVLSNAITRAASVSAEWKSVTKSASYVSNQLLKRLLIEPASALPSGRIYTNNEGERLPYRGGDWYYGADAGLAALSLSYSRASTLALIGFRPAFA